MTTLRPTTRDRSASVDHDPPTPRPRFFYGWVMLAIAMLALVATAPGQTFGVSAFNQPLRESLGLTASQIAGAYGLGTLLASLPMAYIGALMDRYGLKRVMTAVIFLFGLTCILTSQAVGLVSLFFAFFMLRMLGQGALGMLSGNVLAFWFERKLGTVEGLRHFGMALTIGIVPTALILLIGSLGWRWTYALLGLLILAVMLPLMLFGFRNRPEDIGQRKDGLPPHNPAHAGLGQPIDDGPCFTLASAMRTRAFWIATAAAALWGLTNTGLVFSLFPIFAQRGLAEADAQILFASFSISLAIMHVLGGILADRLPLNLLLAFACASMAAVMAFARLIETSWLVYFMGTAMGISQGLLIAVISPLFPRYYGRLHLGRIRGCVTTVMVASTASGPFLLGLCHDWLGAYDPMLTVFFIAHLPLVGFAFYATRPAALPHESLALEDDNNTAEAAPLQ